MTTRSKAANKRPLGDSPTKMGTQVKEGKRPALGEVTNQKNNATKLQGTLGKGGVTKSSKSRLPVGKNTIQNAEAAKKAATLKGQKQISTSTLPGRGRTDSKAGLISQNETKETSQGTSKSKEETKNVKENITEIMNARNAKITEEMKARLPEGVADFDSEGLDDPFQVSEYVFDIFEYYKRREAKFPVKKYLDQETQTELNRNMRAILVDWMVEVQVSFF